MPNITFAETKSTCYLAYDGAAGESYRFPDGTAWSISTTWHSNITGFKAILIQGNGKVVLSFAGTDSLVDVAADISQVLGGVPPQYPQSLLIAFECKRTHQQNLHLSGHSLGGGLAAFCSVETRLSASTINPAPLVGGASFSAMFRNNDQITNYIAGGSEFVSSSVGRNPGRDVGVESSGNFFSRHSLINTAPAVPLPTKI